MKIGGKCTVSQIVKFCVLVIVLLDYNFFYLIRQPSWLQQLNSKSTKILVGGLIILLALFVITRRRGLLVKYRFLFRMECGIVMSVICVGLCTLLHYKSQGVSSTIRIMMPYFIPLLAFPILYLVEYGAYSWEKVLGTIEKIIFIWYIVSIASFVVYQGTGGNFLIGFYSDDQITLRNDNIRMAMFSLGNVALFYNLDGWLNKPNKKTWYLLNLILGLFCVFFIQSTRMFYLADSIGMFIVLFLSGKTTNKKIRNMAILIVVLLVLFQTNTVTNFINSIVYGNETYRYNSTEVRMGAYAYYISAFFGNPLYALGFVSDGVYPSIAHGNLGVYNFNDVGFVGLLGQTGIFSIFIIGIPYIRMMWISYQLLKKRCGKEYSFLIALSVYFLISSMSIIASAPGYAMILPFAYAGFEYVWSRVKKG